MKSLWQFESFLYKIVGILITDDSEDSRIAKLVSDLCMLKLTLSGCFFLDGKGWRLGSILLTDLE